MLESDLTVEEAAALLKVQPTTIRTWAREGRFPNAYQVTRRSGWRIPRSDVDELRKKAAA